jgi:glyoxylase-like metal-dependent hydrolase (beta-lactamase superfamily II)
MQRERVSENVYWFQSEVYAQVTAGVIAGPQWAVLIDTLALPEETLEMRDFIENDLKVPVRYIVTTHHHADHSWGNSFFPGATVIGHTLCRELMLKKSTVALEAARKQNPIYRQVKIVPPHLTFESGTISLRVGKKNLVMMPLEGHSKDGIGVLLDEDRVLFAGDAFMPLPFIVDGDIEKTTNTIKNIGKMGLENIIQGHGDIILRGEIEDAVKENLNYLNAIRKAARAALKKRNPQEFLAEVDIESCGKSRVYLSGLAADLHKQNLRVLFNQYLEEAGGPQVLPEPEPETEVDDDDVL